jgi:hypothetical protein
MTPQAQPSPAIAGSVLPIKRAEELLQTLPGVIAARIIASETGAVDEIHVLTSAEVTPKQTVRNIESALIAHLGMRVDHRKISVATTLENRKPGEREVVTPPASVASPVGGTLSTAATVAAVLSPSLSGTGPRHVFFEDVEVRRSRTKGISCRVTLRKGDQSYTGEAEGMENERSRLELAGRAALKAIAELDSSARVLDLGGARVVEAFDREFVLAAVTAQMVRETVLLTGTCEVKESPETACVLAVLDATNRWLLHPRRG